MAARALHKTRKPRKNPVVETHRFRGPDDLIDYAGRSYFVTYQRELVLCGKPRCAKRHGPYWYAYWTSDDRTRSLYIGKELRPAREVLRERARRR